MADISLTKICSSCNKELPLHKFGQSPLYRDGRRGQCTPCRAAKNKRGPSYNKPLATRAYKLKSRYGMTAEDYDNLLQQQGGVCKICNGSNPKSRWGRFHFDHCHKTGKVRGLLCNPCNVLIGKFRDNAQLFQKYADYLRSEGEEC